MNQNKIDKSKRHPPSETCVICEKSLEEIGGKRIIAQKPRGIIISNEYQDSNKGRYPRHSYELSDNSDKYLVVWGEKELWTDDVIERAKEEYVKGQQSWFCQVCGNRTCEDCGTPLSIPMGSDILDDSGNSSHVAVLPVKQACVNPKCKK